MEQVQNEERFIMHLNMYLETQKNFFAFFFFQYLEMA
jgi:hypothetical protein